MSDLVRNPEDHFSHVAALMCGNNLQQLRMIKGIHSILSFSWLFSVALVSKIHTLSRHCVFYGLEPWIGVFDWSLGLEHWCGFLEWIFGGNCTAGLRLLFGIGKNLVFS